MSTYCIPENYLGLGDRAVRTIDEVTGLMETDDKQKYNIFKYKQKWALEMFRQHHWPKGHDLSTLQEIVKDTGAWSAAVHGVTKSWTQLSDWTTTNIVRWGYRDGEGQGRPACCSLWSHKQLAMTAWLKSNSKSLKSVGNSSSYSKGLCLNPSKSACTSLIYNEL